MISLPCFRFSPCLSWKHLGCHDTMNKRNPAPLQGSMAGIARHNAGNHWFIHLQTLSMGCIPFLLINLYHFDGKSQNHHTNVKTCFSQLVLKFLSASVFPLCPPASCHPFLTFFDCASPVYTYPVPSHFKRTMKRWASPNPLRQQAASHLGQTDVIIIA